MICLLEQQVRARLVDDPTPTKAFTASQFVNFDTYTLITNANRSRCTLHTCTFNHIYINSKFSQEPQGEGRHQAVSKYVVTSSTKVDVFRSVQTVFLNRAWM